MSAFDANYHRLQFEIAHNPSDPRWIQPEIPSNARRVLDVGCGAGQTLEAAGVERRAAFGVDLEIDALTMGQGMRVPAHFACAQGEKLPFRDGSFDFVFSRVALPYMNIPAALCEMARVLAPGGAIWLAMHPLSRFDWRYPFTHPKRTAFESYRLANTMLFHITGNVTPFPLLKNRYECYQTERGMRRALARAGFCEIRIDRSPHFIATARKL